MDEINDAVGKCPALETLTVGDVERWVIDKYNPLQLKELRLTGRRWETVPSGLADWLQPNARVVGPNFVGKKLGKFIVMKG
jgi:hypothetical protein